MPSLIELMLDTAIKEAGDFLDVRLSKEFVEVILDNLKERPQVVNCRDCAHWKPPHIKLNDGKQRLYREGDFEDDPFKMSVPSDVGLNVGGMCWLEHNRGYGRDMRVFRNEDDYCSRAIKLPDGMTAAENFGLSTEPAELTDDFDY